MIMLTEFDYTELMRIKRNYEKLCKLYKAEGFIVCPCCAGRELVLDVSAYCKTCKENIVVWDKDLKEEGVK